MDVDVEADHRAVDDEAARPERRPRREAGGIAHRDLLQGGGEVRLANVETARDRGHGPRLEVDVPHRAVIELGRRLRDFLEDVQWREWVIENGGIDALPLDVVLARLPVGEGD